MPVAGLLIPLAEPKMGSRRIPRQSKAQVRVDIDESDAWFESNGMLSSGPFPYPAEIG
jgi:hypothetical protein